MVGKKKEPIDDAAAMAGNAATDIPPARADSAPAGEPAGAGDVPAPVRTRDRDPADRLAWKRERAKQLGIPRD